MDNIGEYRGYKIQRQCLSSDEWVDLRVIGYPGGNVVIFNDKEKAQDVATRFNERRPLREYRVVTIDFVMEQFVD